VARPTARRQLGAWYTPDALVETVVENVVTREFVERRAGRRLRVLDPACGDGRFLAAAGRRIASFGGVAELTGVDIDAGALAAAAERVPSAITSRDDALRRTWDDAAFDLVVGNPPFLSPLAASTNRAGSSRRGGGPYADAAVEFLALAAELVDADGGRVALVLPQSILAARDAAAVRDDIDERARMVWSWWTGERVFDAQVYTCALAFEFTAVPGAGTAQVPGRRDARRPSWAHVVTGRQGVPPVPDSIESTGTLSDRARLNANFRDEYYGMAPAVGDHASGPQLITSGLIDPGRSLWGDRSITFARRRFDRPRLDLAKLSPSMRRWADLRLTPKVLVANQTRIIEAVCDPTGAWLPAVPVVGIYPNPGEDTSAVAWQIAAVLTSPIASAWVWHRSAGTGLSAAAVRMSPVVLGDLPWPAGGLDPAVVALRSGDARGCAAEVMRAWSCDGDGGALFDWWSASLERIEARQPSGS
jgi:SAM-dependent methyltransferase